MNRREKIIELMKKNNIKNQTQLIKEIKNKLNEKLDKNTMSNIMNPERNISNQTIQILSDFFEVPLDYFKVDSWEETSIENNKIKEYLGLSESSINAIKKANTQMDSFNLFLTNFSNMEDFLENYKYYVATKTILGLLDDFDSFFELEELILEAQKNKNEDVISRIFKYYHSIISRIESISNKTDNINKEELKKQYSNEEDFLDFYENIEKFVDILDLENTFNLYEDRIRDNITPSDKRYIEMKAVRDAFDTLHTHMKRELKFFKYNLSDSLSVSLEKIQFPKATVTAEEFVEEYKKIQQPKNKNKNKK